MVGWRVKALADIVSRVVGVKRMVMVLATRLVLVVRRRFALVGAVVRLGLGVAIRVTTGSVFEGDGVSRTVLRPAALLCAGVRMRLAALESVRG